MNKEEIILEIKSIFSTNYERLRLEGGPAITKNVIDAALEQVLYYFDKLYHIAENVTETEVKLTLPDRITPDGRRFTIEGVVDIVREGEVNWMYDIKTHDPEYIKANRSLYADQLLVYTYIYQELRGNKLDNAAIISTALPEELKNAIRTGNPAKIEGCYKTWQPIIEIPFDEDRINETILKFAKTVDLIESHSFGAPDLEILNQKVDGTRLSFATRVCRNCDVRFSCPSFEAYYNTTSYNSSKNITIFETERVSSIEQDEFVMANLIN